jgi:hypothetical protein
MKVVINSLLAIGTLILSYLLYSSIQEPIEFKDFKEAREFDVRRHLEDVARAQEAYKSIKGRFAPSWDSLELVLTQDSFKTVIIIGDPDDIKSGKTVQKQITYTPVGDSINRILRTVKDVKKLRYVPNANTANTEFKIQSAILKDDSGNETPVFEASTIIENYMGEKFKDKKYSLYDDTYDPKSLRKVGDMYQPKTTGNWK